MMGFAGKRNRKSAGILLWIVLTLSAAAVCCAQESSPAEFWELEKIWEEEDLRQESETPLTETLLDGDRALGFDRDSATFYCVLDGTAEEWPQIDLHAENGIALVWVDEYFYDSPRDAVRDGTRYELVMMNDTQFADVGVIFTSLPQVSLSAQEEEIGMTDVPGEFRLTDPVNTFSSGMMIHWRGGGREHRVLKESYHAELRKTDDGKKNKQSLLEMNKDSDWLLIGNAHDCSGMANQIAWELWREWQGENAAAIPQSRMVELFLNGRYDGLYQFSERIRAKHELKEMGGSEETDIVARMVKVSNEGWRPRKCMDGDPENLVELRYVPEGMSAEEGFGALEPLYRLLDGGTGLSDEEFADNCGSMLDVQNLADYYLLIQSTGNYDSLDNRNNVYIWAMQDGNGAVTYRLTPWDLDSSFGSYGQPDEADPEKWLSGMKMIERMLDLDVNGIREVLWERWRMLRSGILSDEQITARFETAAEEISASGAFARESERWRDAGETEMYPDVFTQYMITRLGWMDSELAARWPEPATEKEK